MSGYPCQPYSPRLDAVDAALNVGGTSFQPGFVNNVNGLQRFRVLADGGDGYATFNFDATSILGDLPTLSVVATPEDFYVQQANSTILLDRTRTVISQGSRSLEINASGYFVSDPANFRTAINGASLAGNNFTGLQTFSGLDSVGIRLKSLTSVQYGNLTPGNGDLYLDTTTNRIDARINGTTRELIDSSGGQTINGNLTASGQLFVNSINNYYDNPSSGQGRWQTPFAGTYTFQQNQSGQSMTVQLATSELRLAGLQHWDVASGNGRRLDLFSQAAVPITVRPAGVLAMTWDTSGNTTVSGTVNVTTNGSDGCLLTPSILRGAFGQTFNIGSGFTTSADNIAALRMRGAGVISFGNQVAMMSAAADQMEINNNTAGQYRDLLLRNLTASGTVNAALFQNGAGSTTINGNGGQVILQTGGFNRWQISANHWVPSTTNVWDLGSTTNRVRDLYVGGINATGTISGGVITGSTSLNTNSISRNTPTNTLTLGFGSMPTAFHSVTIGGGGSLTNSSGIAGYLRLDSVVNQTGTAGSADILINRTETAIGSGTHRYIDLQNAGTSRWYVDRLGDQYFCQGADSTRIARAAGATGRLIIYRPNDPATPTVEFGGGNDEIRIRGGLGTLNHSGANFQIISTSALQLGATGNMVLGTNGSTALTITGADSVLGGNLSWSDVRIPRTTKAFRTECFESTLSAWQETSRQEASATGARWSCLGATPIVRQTLPATATDAATTQSLANSIRSLLINFGFAN